MERIEPPTLADWTKEVQRRYGFRNADTLAAKMGVSRNTVALIQSDKRTNITIKTARALLRVAQQFPDLLANPPAIFEGLGLISATVVTMTDAMKGYVATTEEGGTVAKDIDRIENEFVRLRARNAALNAIEQVRIASQMMPPGPEPEPAPRSEKKKSR